VIVAAPDPAAGPSAEFWIGDERLAGTIVYDGRLHLRLDPRPDGEPWLVEAASLALAIDTAARHMAR